MNTNVSLLDRRNRGYEKRRFYFLAGALLAVLGTHASLKADSGIPVPAGTWTMVLTKGIPAATNGWEQLVYAPAIKRSIMLSMYHQRNSEPNESMIGYQFDTNSWDVIDMGGNFHTENMPEGGESQGYFDFNPNNNTIVYHCCTTGSNQVENISHTWWYDVLGQSGMDRHTSPKPPAPALQPGGAFDRAHNVFMFHGGDSFVGTWTYNPTTNTWQQMFPSGTVPNPSLILAGVAYSTNNQKLYLVGGLSPAGYNTDLYVYDFPTNTWTLINPAGGIKPPGRYRHAFAYDSTNNIFLLYGGQNSSGILNDTWAYDPSANTWTQLNPPQAPTIPTSAIFARMSYDSDHNVFVLAQLGQNGYYGGSWNAYSIQTWLFRYHGTGPNAGTQSSTAAPAPGSMNRNPGGWAKDPVLTSSGSSLYVAWSELGPPFNASDIAWPHIYVDQFSGGGWTHLGTTFQSVSSTAIKEAHAPAMTVVNGVPWTSWYESDNAGHTAAVYSKSWDGLAWNGGAVGLNSTDTRLFQGQSQLAAVGTVPHVALLEVDKDVFPQRTSAFVRFWNGSAWTQKGTSLNRNGGAGSTALAVSITSDGSNPYVAWSEYLHSANSGNGYDNDANPQIYVSQWNGSQWVAVGTSLNFDTANWAYDPSIAFLNGSIYVAWTERTKTGNAQLYVKTWNGSSWTLVGSGSLNQAPGVGWAYHPSLVANAASNKLYLGWVEQTALGQKARVYAAQYSGGSWSSLGSTLNADPVQGSAQRVTLGVFNGQPVAAWSEVNMGALRQVYVKQWNGSSWTMLSGLGAPDTTSPNAPPSISAIATSSSQVKVVWTASADLVGVTGYFVYRGGVQVAEVTSTLNYTDTGLSPNTAYTYRVAAHDAAGNLSPQSGAANATTFATPLGSGGTLAGSVAASPASVQLTAEGSADWAQWGMTSANSFNHKSGVTQQISNYTAIGSPAAAYVNNPVQFSWTDGMPTASATTATGVFVGGEGEGFRITATADRTVRTLRVYVGAYRAQGRMVAQLSDGSAADYTDVSLSNNAGNPTAGVYTFTYSAASSGQTLVVTFTQSAASGGNVELQAATLSSGTPAPDFAVAATPSSQSVVRGGNVNYNVTVTALNGFTGTVGFTVSGLPAGAGATFNPTTVPGGGPSTMNVTTSTATAGGSYPLTITATSGALFHTTSVTLNVSTGGGGGSLGGSVANPPTSVSLTAEGTADWVHWGLNTATDFNHKTGVTPQIGNFTSVGGATAIRFTANPVAYNWTDGTPTSSGSNVASGVYVTGQGQGFRIVALADTTVRTLRVYVGVWRAQTQMVAHLSDGSAADFTDTSLLNTAGVVTCGVYTLTYSAASSGQSLTVTFTQTSTGSGNVNLQAATLTGGSTGAPDFTVAGTPSTQSVVAGNSTTFTATVSALNGFTGSVGLSVSGLPSGATGTFNPTSITNSGPSTLTVTTTAATAPGSYPLTITATSGTTTHTANVTLNVSSGSDFSIAGSPGSQTVAAGSGTTFTATVSALNGFTGSVGLSVSGLPSGATGSFNPTSITNSGSSTLTVTTTAATAPGSYPLTITATSGTITHTANVTLNISGASDFSITASPGTQSVAAGSSTGFTATVSALNGFTGSVGLSISGLPSGATGSFNPTSITNSGSSTLTVNTTAATTPGSYPLTITATSGSLSHTANVTVNITGFSLAATPPTQSVAPGSNTTFTATVTALNGFSGTVGLSVSGLPSGATGSFNPTSITGPGSSTLTITTTASVATGNFPLTITGNSGNASRTTNVTLTIGGPPDFTVGASPSSGSVTPGGNVPYTVTVSALNGFSGTVGFTVGGLPSGASAGFNPTTVTASGTSTMTVTTTAATATGSYPLTITATSGALSHTANVTLNVTSGGGGGGTLSGAVVNSPGSVALTTEGTTDWAHWGMNTATDFNHKAAVVSQIGNFSSVAGATAARFTGNPVVYGWTDGTPTASASNVASGVYVSGQNQGFRVVVPAQTTSRTLRVYIGVWRAQAKMVAHLSDGSAADYVDTSLTNTAGPVTSAVYTLTYSAASAGQSLTVTFTQNTAGTGNVNLQAATLSGGTVSPDFMISATPPTRSVGAGSAATYTVTTSALNGFSGSVGLSVSGTPAGATVGFNPASITGSGTSTLTVTTAAGTTAGNYGLTITGTSGALTHTANVTLTVTGVGSLAGAVTNSPASVALTAEGSADWAHWGLNAAADFNHKGNVTSQIANFSSVAGGTAARFTGNPVIYSWTDGTPTTSASNVASGVYLSGVNQGFRVVVPADTTVRTLRIYVGVWRAQSKMVAHLSDGSAVDYIDTSLVNTAGVVTSAYYTLTYHAASIAQTLTVTFTQTNATTGNVNLQAATLQ